VPHDADRDTYLVLNDFGRLGRAWCEADEEGTDRETLIRRFLADQFSHPVRIVAFNTAEGWSRDVTVDIADELRRRSIDVYRRAADYARQRGILIADTKFEWGKLPDTPIEPG